MAYDTRKIANSFSLPKRPFLSGVASLVDFSGSYTRYYAKQILDRSDADAIRADWEAVGASLWWAIGQHKENEIEESLSG
ncbi:MAG: hypothetical protein OXG92_01845 [Chloroflexi bacterium]|nr:hypothetical protein [Chloroflexota bacterium]MCY3582696.1 hypothetical protein [Chloroflexota bacterium]MCY3715194.1 hypothetical protein [Chloroflexota bacterium]MDE2649965.1 hypothetical protein [Chloroflexota bacterium]MXV92326.1 hypothetical protein [Chloroflexota bacterium]